MTNLKPAITKLRDITGRKITGYMATLGCVEGRGKTEREASEACIAAAATALSNMSATVLWNLWPDENGVLTCWILTPNGIGGWEYRIARPMRPGSHYDGMSACMVPGDRDAVLDAMRAHWYTINVKPFADMLRSIARLANG